MSIMEMPMVWDTCIYARKSTTKYGQKETVENQLEGCHNEASKYSLRIVDEKIDTGTGTDDLSRPAVKELIEDAISKKYNCVIMKGISRFYRDVEKGLALIKQLDRHGVRVITIEESFDSFKDRTGTGKLDTSKITMYLMFAEMESKKTADRVKFTQVLKAKRGEWNHANSTPFGYDFDSETKKLKVNQTEARIVKLIFEMYTSGIGMREIMHYLNGDNEEKIQYPSPKGKVWSQFTIGFMLKNHAYAGHVVYNKRSKKERVYKHPELYGKAKDDIWIGNDKNDEKDWIICEHAHEAIVNQEIFDFAEKVMNTKATRKGIRSNVGLLAGIGKCGACGASLTFKRGNRDTKGRIKTKSNYYCIQYIKYGKNFCSSHHVGSDELESFVINHLKTMYSNKQMLDDAFIKRKAAMPNKVESLARQKVQIESDIKKTTSKMDKLLEKNLDGDITDAQFKSMNSKYSNELDMLLKEVAKMQLEIDKESNDNELEVFFRDKMDEVSRIDDMTKEETRYLLLDLVEKVVLDPSGVVDIVYKFNNWN